MRLWINSLSGEILKYKRSSFLWLHIIIPLAGACIVALYYQSTIHSSENKLFMYITLVAAAYPFMISVVTAICFHVEEECNFYYLLSATNRNRILAIKMFILYILGCLTTLLAEILSPILLGTKESLTIFLQLFMIIAVPNMILYILHSYLYLRFGKSVSIFIGVIGTMISMLFLTGLGDGIWKFVPFSMGTRGVNLLLCIENGNSELKQALVNDFNGFPLICLLEVVIVTVLFFYWFQRWEGRKVYE